MAADGKRTCCCSLLITIFLVVIYWLGHHINLPFVDKGYFSSIDGSGERFKINVFILGLVPFFTGFILVELFSLLIAKRGQTGPDEAQSGGYSNKHSAQCIPITATCRCDGEYDKSSGWNLAGSESWLVLPSVNVPDPDGRRCFYLPYSPPDIPAGKCQRILYSDRFRYPVSRHPAVYIRPQDCPVDGNVPFY